MITPPKTTLNQMLKAWQNQVHAATDKPWLFTLLMRQWERLFRRFAHYYQQLLALPRPHKRALKRTLATTLAGAALLLALGQALPAHAATITVDGVSCTLKEAITSANNDNAAGNGCVDGSGADVIDLQMDVLLTSILPIVTSQITLEGNGHTIDGNNNHAVLKIQAAGNLIVNNITITGGSTNSNGAGITNTDGVVEVNNSTVSGNSAGGDGGGILNDGGMLILNSSNVSGNSAGNYGGGISNIAYGVVYVNNSTISGNSAHRGGGVFNTTAGIVTVNSSTLSGNSADQFGGGVFNSSGTLTVNNSVLNDNIAASPYSGGGIFNGSYSPAFVNDSIFNGNTASFGGGIHNNGFLTVDNSTFSDNSASTNGGGILNGGTLTINNSTLSANSVDGSNFGGGGISNFGTLTVNNSTLRDNFAAEGGGIRNFGQMTVNNSTLSGNSANNGGGIAIVAGLPMTLNNSTVTGNLAIRGGGIYIFNTSYNTIINLNRNLISGNLAEYGAEVHNLETVNANNYNVVGYSGSPRSVGFVPGPLDIIPPGPLDTVLDILLADNGGPTFTHALVSGSAAIDAAPNAPCLAPPINGIDQRGFPRNVDGDGSPSSNECDAGAFEYAPSGVPTPTPTVISTTTATATETGSPTAISTPTSTGLPDTTPTARPTRTPTPRPTRTPTPTLIVDSESVLVPPAQEQVANSLMNVVVVTLLALGNLLFFRKGRA